MEENDLDSTSNSSEIVFVDELKKSAIAMYKPTNSNLLKSTKDLPLDVSREIMKVLNSGIRIADLANHLKITKQAISAHAKFLGFKWIVEQRKYFSPEEYTSYRQKKIKTVEDKIIKKRRPRDMKKLVIKLPIYYSNLLDLRVSAENTSIEGALCKLLEQAASEDHRLIAKSFTLVTKAKVIVDED
jgi:hypothetical protein